MTAGTCCDVLVTIKCAEGMCCYAKYPHIICAIFLLSETMEATKVILSRAPNLSASHLNDKEYFPKNIIKKLNEHFRKIRHRMKGKSDT
jgi:hypothetical protein